MRRLTTSGHAAIDSEFEPSLYPRTYKATIGNRIGWISLASVAGIAGLCGALYFGKGHETHSRKDVILTVSTSLLFVLLGGYLILWILRSRIILRTDAIEARNILSTQIMRRSEIGEWRILSTQYISTLELIPSEKAHKKLRFGLTIKMDPQFHAWFAGIPNLDAEELAKSEAEIAANEELGLTPGQRVDHLARAKKLASWLNRVAFVIALWGWLYPRPYRPLILAMAVMPLAVIVLLVRTNGIYQIEGRRNDARPSLAISFIFPAVILAFRSLTGFEFLRWEPVLAWVAIGGLGLMLLIASADRRMRERRWPLLAILLFTAAYAYGAIAQADTLLDKSAPRTFEATILSKRISNGETTTWYLRVGPWGPQPEPREVSVSRSLYGAVLPNQVVCVHLSDGALKIPWYFVSDCRQGSSATTPKSANLTRRVGFIPTLMLLPVT